MFHFRAHVFSRTFFFQRYISDQPDAGVGQLFTFLSAIVLARAMGQ